MSRREGITGTGAIYYPADPGLLRGVLASEHETKVYPEDRCELCEAEGKLTADEKCFHRHWSKEKEEAK